MLTATAAGTLLGALWFVPSANATTPETSGESALASTQTSAEGDAGQPDVQLADTGSVDTTPYVVGGTLLLCLGAGFVTYSVRRERMDF